MTDTTRRYLFDTSSDLGHTHMKYLAEVMDPATTACLDEIGIEPGWRCLDLGAGGGSITRWLAERTGPTGRVVAVDLDTDHLEERPGVEVYGHDINSGLPVTGPFHLIHARLLLMHLPRRVPILQTLVDALAPGGWLVIGDVSGRPRRVLATPDTTPEDADARLFERIQDIAHNTVARGAGVSPEWAHEVDWHLAECGLINIAGLEHSRTTTGGAAGCLLHRNLVMQTDATLRRAGLTDEDLVRYRDLMLDPRFRAWGYQLVCTWGQKPVKEDLTAGR